MTNTPSPSRHVETFTGIATGEQILVWCDCPVGHDHRSGPGDTTGAR
ncbi:MULTISPECIES: hypothetical protein [unclassified Curtobacterium]|nr:MULTISPECIES: hypothetical protein [unclassified Curtobacterium]WIA98211.1 hypothetical protein QOL16_07445 [Curtobacterium sp. MCBA15_004]WIB01465.1 hypothetical protein QOL15_07200 [Curtobacterium sp. MCBA15_012]